MHCLSVVHIRNFSMSILFCRAERESIPSYYCQPQNRKIERFPHNWIGLRESPLLSMCVQIYAHTYVCMRQKQAKKTASITRCMHFYAAENWSSILQVCIVYWCVIESISKSGWLTDWSDQPPEKRRLLNNSTQQICVVFQKWGKKKRTSRKNERNNSQSVSQPAVCVRVKKPACVVVRRFVRDYTWSARCTSGGRRERHNTHSRIQRISKKEWICLLLDVSSESEIMYFYAHSRMHWCNAIFLSLFFVPCFQVCTNTHIHKGMKQRQRRTMQAGKNANRAVKWSVWLYSLCLNAIQWVISSIYMLILKCIYKRESIVK